MFLLLDSGLGVSCLLNSITMRLEPLQTMRLGPLLISPTSSLSTRRKDLVISISMGDEPHSVNSSLLTFWLTC